MKLRSTVEKVSGLVCEIVIPISDRLFYGKGRNVCICTLASMDLLKEIVNQSIMQDVLIVGRLLSENSGIDQLIQRCLTMTQIEYLILCGKDAKGHFPGDALINLTKNGLDEERMIIGSISKRAFLKVSDDDIYKFKKQVSLIDMRGCFDIEQISKAVSNLCC